MRPAASAAIVAAMALVIFSRNLGGGVATAQELVTVQPSEEAAHTEPACESIPDPEQLLECGQRKWQRTGSYAEAIPIWEDARRKAESDGNARAMCAAMRTLAQAYAKEGRLERAIAEQEHLIRLQSRHGTKVLPSDLRDLALLYDAVEMHDQAETIWMQLLAEDERLEGAETGLRLLDVSRHHFKKGDYTASVEYFERAQRILHERGLGGVEVAASAFVAAAYHELGKHEKALEVRRAQVAAAREIGQEGLLVEALEAYRESLIVAGLEGEAQNVRRELQRIKSPGGASGPKR